MRHRPFFSSTISPKNPPRKGEKRWKSLFGDLGVAYATPGTGWMVRKPLESDGWGWLAWEFWENLGWRNGKVYVKSGFLKCVYKIYKLRVV